MEISKEELEKLIKSTGEWVDSSDGKEILKKASIEAQQYIDFQPQS